MAISFYQETILKKGGFCHYQSCANAYVEMDCPAKDCAVIHGYPKRKKIHKNIFELILFYLHCC